MEHKSWSRRDGEGDSLGCRYWPNRYDTQEDRGVADGRNRFRDLRIGHDRWRRQWDDVID